MMRIFMTAACIGLLACGTDSQSPKTSQVSAPKATASKAATPPETTLQKKPTAAVAPKKAPQKASTSSTPIPEKKTVAARPAPQGVQKLPPSRFSLTPLRAKGLVKHAPVEPPTDRRNVGSVGLKTKADLKEASEAAQAGQPLTKRGAPPIRRINEHSFEVGRIVVDQKAKRITVNCLVNQTEGILEYYAVGPKGKTHESVLQYVGLASHVHIGLLLLGQEPKKKGGAPLKLTVQWRDPKSKTLKKAPAERWLFDRTTKAAATTQTWRFTGSSFWRGNYGGDASATLISTIPDQNTVIELDAEAGNPYRGADQGFEVHQVTIPPKGTPVSLFIEPADAKQ